MPNFGDPADDDDCGCTMGRACVYHQAERDRERVAYEADCARKGIDPDGEIDGPAFGKMLDIWTDRDLSPNEKERRENALLRSLIPARKP